MKIKNWLKPLIQKLLLSWGYVPVQPQAHDKYFVCSEFFPGGKTEMWFSDRTRLLHRDDGPAKITTIGNVVILEHFHHGRRTATGGSGDIAEALRIAPHNSAIQRMVDNANPANLPKDPPREFIASGIDGIRRRYRVYFGGYEEIPMCPEDL